MSAKRGTFNNFQGLKLILQPGSDDELEVDHYDRSNKIVEDEDFAKDVPKIDGNTEYETDKDSEVNDESGANDGGERKVFCLHFSNNAADKQENVSRSEETLIFYRHQMSCLCVTCTFYGDFLKTGDFG